MSGAEQTGAEVLALRAARQSALGACTALLLALAVSFVSTRSDAPALVMQDEVGLRLDPNVATAAELELLPGIGPKLAKNIVAFRAAVSSRPAFRCAEDLDAVRRIGPITVDRLRPYLSFPLQPVTGQEEQ